MPRYIEFNEETSFPASVAGTDIIGIDSADQLVITNSSGKTTVAGSTSPLNYTTYMAKLTQIGEGELTSGYLTTGKTYIINKYYSDDDFSNVANVQSGIINTDGCVFIATGTTPTVWKNGSSLQDPNYPLPAIDENTFDFTPYWKNFYDKGYYYFNFPSSVAVNYNKLTYKFTPTSMDNVLSNIAINPTDYSFYDETFNIGGGFDNPVYTTAIQTDGKIICGGQFTQFDGSSTGYGIARLNSDGTLDGSFSVGTGFDSSVQAVAIQSDGKIICIGEFSTYKENPIASRIARLDNSGSLDTTFNTNAGTGFDAKAIQAIALQPDGKIVCGGNSLSNFNGTAVNGIFRLNTDGTLDTTFNSGGSGLNDKPAVRSIAIQPDGKIVCVGVGDFSSYNGIPVAYEIMRLNTDGTLDTAFNTNAGTGFDREVYTVAIQSDGKIFCGGDFGFFNDIGTLNYIVRLNADGTYDSTFLQTPGFNSTVYTILLDAADNAFIGGSFNSYNNITSNCIIRLDNSGSILNTFNNGFNTTVYTISQQSDGKIVVGGNFTAYSGYSNYYTTRLFSAYDVVLTSRKYNQTTDNSFLLNNPVEIKLYN